jgi:maltose alpha-D-glucosyltransferase/alpha-amylase
MIAVRKQHPAFGRGDFTFLLPEDTSILAYFRQYREEVILVINNLSSNRQEVVLDLRAFAGTTPVDLVSGIPQSTVGQDPYRLRLSPHEYLWLILKHAQA